MNLFDLSGKKALVTGGSRGLGWAMAEALLEFGAEVAIIGSSERVTATAAELGQATGQRAVPLQADLADREQLQQAFAESLRQLGTLDILIVSHGVQRRAPAEEFPLETWDFVLEVNLTSMFILNQMAGQVMLAKGKGKIINIASLLSFSGGITVPAYAAAKGGVARLTMALSNEWASRGVNVNAIAPGYMNTEMNEALIANPTRNQQILDRIPAKRWGEPEDMKGAAVFLASAASDYINGVIIPVDGGWMGR
ncbi:MAG: SDR family oxidoreductase [Anaerolineae bacterium]|nr:SDR family oxidoreductase [Anaerolineae bacterium]